MSARINVLAADQAAIRRIGEELDLPEFIATTLVARGIDTVDAVRQFLTPSLDRDWRNPYDIEGMEEAVAKLVDAIKAHKRILVYGDFDLDGISATTIMTRGLRECSAEVVPFIPHRFDEGYGLSQAAIDRLSQYEPDLLITVDNGIAAKVEVETLLGMGIDVVITDHHEPADLVPVGVPVVDPKCNNNPSSILAGAGVALKVIQAVGSHFGQPNLWRSLVDLATLGTVADLMPMRDENRALVSVGIDMINNEPRTCIAALLGESGFADKPMSATNLSFTIVPRLNAAGRMGNAQLALDLLLCDDFTEAAHLASELEATNNRRREIEAELSQVAMAQAEETYDGKRALVVAGEDWHEGVKGIVASRLTNKYGVPSILFTIEGDEAHGSGRSVGEVNLFDAVSSCQDILTRFGGHHAAVGVTLPADKLPEFRQRLCEYMDTLPADEFLPRITVDSTVDFSELTIQNVEKLDMLAPFGQENPNPRFLAHGVMIAGGRAVGADKNHLSATLTDGVANLASIMFHCPDVQGLLHAHSAMDAVFELQIDSWKGRRNVKAVINSLVPVAPCPTLEACLEDEDKDFVSDLVAAGDEGFDSDSRDRQGWEMPPADRIMWAERAKEDPAAFREDLIRALLGDGGTLHASQLEALSLLDGGKSVFAVMGTGRGKSLIFHVHAAELALSQEKSSVFIYPLRALVADQAFHLDRVLGAFGIVTKVLTGASTPEERKAVMQHLHAGEVDIILTTPEYFDIHTQEFAEAGNIGFVVVDEAHHVGTSKAGFRPSYARLGDAVARLGTPQVIATTATADESTACAICKAFNLDRSVLDDTARTNLLIDDQRGVKKRDRYLVNLVAQGEKTLIYVNSRMESVALVRELRRAEPHIASLIGFYNAGLSRAERNRIEDLFREGSLQVLVTTSAFGEGVDIPGVRHVVLYHLPFSEVEFNQMSGRAGRDGEEAQVHLLFGKSDARINSDLLNDSTPSHDTMGQMYRQIRAMQRSAAPEPFAATLIDIAQGSANLLGGCVPSIDQVRCAIEVFSELGLIELPDGATDTDEPLRINVVDYKGKVDLVDSVRYREGVDERDSFIVFKDWVLSATADQLQQRIQHPLMPWQPEAGKE